jgi:hypothetical protein
MIVSKDINPERDVYYLGAKLIGIIESMGKEPLDFFDLFHNLNKEKGTSINLFILTLDWLYLTGAIKKNDKGDIERCF